MKLLIFVYTCTKYEKSRALLQQQSWANREDIIFITDNPKSELKNSMYLGNYGNVYFKEQHVMTTYKPSVDLENNYSRMFGSGIQIASSIR